MHSRSTRVQLFLRLVTVISTIFLVASSRAFAETKRIGYIIPLTGDAAVFGQEVQRGLEIARRKLEKRNLKVELLFEDEKCLPKEAVNAWHNLAVSKSVPVIVGPACAGSILAAVPLANAEKRPVVALWDAGRAVEKSGDFVYSIGFDSENEGGIIASHLIISGLKKVSVLWEEDKFAELVKEAFSSIFTGGGGAIVSQASVAPGEQTLNAVVTRLLASHPQALFISPAYSAAAMVKTIRKLGFAGPVFGQDTLGIPGVIEAGGQSMEGVIFADIRVSENDSAVQEFKSEYRAQFGEEASSLTFAAFGYDSLMAAVQLPEDPLKQRELLPTLTWDGVLPTSSFKGQRMVRLQPALFQVRDGKIVPFTGG